MPLSNFLKPTEIEDNRVAHLRALSMKQMNEVHRQALVKRLEEMKAEHVSGPDFTPAKNLTIQEGLYRALWPELYREIDELDGNILLNQQTIEACQQTRQYHAQLIAYFQVAAEEAGLS